MLSFGKLNYHRSDIRLFGIQSLARLPLDIRAKVKQTRHKTMTVKVYSPLPVHSQCICAWALTVYVLLYDRFYYMGSHACMITHSLTQTCVHQLSAKPLSALPSSSSCSDVWLSAISGFRIAPSTRVCVRMYSVLPCILSMHVLSLVLFVWLFLSVDVRILYRIDRQIPLRGLPYLSSSLA